MRKLTSCKTSWHNFAIYVFKIRFKVWLQILSSYCSCFESAKGFQKQQLAQWGFANHKFELVLEYDCIFLLFHLICSKVFIVSFSNVTETVILKYWLILPFSISYKLHWGWLDRGAVLEEQWTVQMCSLGMYVWSPALLCMEEVRVGWRTPGSAFYCMILMLQLII